MNCEKCGTKKATVFYKENLNGKIRSLNLCAQCAEKLRQTGELEDFSSPFLNFLSPLISYQEQGTAGFLSGICGKSSGTVQDKVCPICGMTTQKLFAEGLAGCPSCYETFHDEIVFAPNVRSAYTGEVPRCFREKQEKVRLLKDLKQQLGQAVTEERYEDAAKLRDRIRGLGF